MKLTSQILFAVIAYASTGNALEAQIFDETATLANSTDADGFMAYTSEQMTDFKDESIKLNGKVPAYVVGDYVNACPTLFKAGKYSVGSFADGFIRFNRYRIDGKSKTMLFSSKLVDDTKYYKASMKHGEPQAALFAYPTPKRMADRVPGISYNWC
jgi:hypothetical protein